MENNTFNYTYNAKQQEEILNIRKKYVAPTESKLEQLRRLDAQVYKKAAGASIVVGIIGTLLLGSGMSLAMTDIADYLALTPALGMLIGIITGLLGMAVIALAYPVYRRILKRERAKIAAQIIILTDELMQQ